MKKIIGLAVLATMPVACGTVPTAPEVMLGATAPTADASFAAAGRGRAVPPGCTTTPDWASFSGITLNEVRADKTSVTVRAELIVIGDIAGPTPCFNPVFSVNSIGRVGGTLTSGWDRQEATLTGPGGQYMITAFTQNDQKAGLSASLQVELSKTVRR